MLNYETLLSSYDDKLTLMQWLKKVEEALKDASAVSFNVNKRGDATLTFSVVFEDGSELETDPIILQQGESVQAATIRNGHLILTLTNGDELDAGDLGGVIGFSINASQHLIVTYQNGTTQDLGAIFSGNVVINGNFEVTGLAKLPNIEGDTNGNIYVDADVHISDGSVIVGDGEVSTPILNSANDQIEAQKPVVEVMTGYDFTAETPSNAVLSIAYAGAVKNGNKLTFTIVGTLKRTDTIPPNNLTIGYFTIPNNIGVKLVPLRSTWLRMDKQYMASNYDAGIDLPCLCYKEYNTKALFNLYKVNDLTLDVEYTFRIETTFLLSENLAA